ncbi:MAG: aminomethyl-transferring glycine dehydrogenase subunit GcvPB [Promethearchaeota archaeon]
MHRSNITLIFDRAINDHSNNYIPRDIPEIRDLNEIIPKKLLRDDLDIPDIPEIEIIRHYTNLSHKNYGLDTGIYPLGSCTMKYNPKINEFIARLEEFSMIHPLQQENLGCVELINKLSAYLQEITGMDAFTLQPAAGAHGELTGLLIMKKYFEDKGIKKDKLIVPESAHGTNPASATMAGFSIIALQTNKEGEVPLDHLKFAMQEHDVAGIMLTNPNTLGLFERNIKEITSIIHENGGLCYYDGANLNPLLGNCRPGDMGFDIIHVNLHKTFGTPHGGGGPGAGPVGVKKELAQYLPGFENNPKSIGKVKSFYGNFGILIRAYAYICALGSNGLKKAGQIAVLNANYLRVNLENLYYLPYQRICQHEFVLSEKNLPNDLTIEDVAKRMLDYGIYPPTIYFPLIVKGAMMIEPTETESKNTLDSFLSIMTQIFEEAKTNPSLLRSAPQKTPIGRLNAVLAARNPCLHD